MNEVSMKTKEARNSLNHALGAWTRHGNEQPLTQWFKRQMDARGALMQLDIADWHECVTALLHAETQAASWPSNWVAPLKKLVEAIRWYSRPDGTLGTVFKSPSGNTLAPQNGREPGPRHVDRRLNARGNGQIEAPIAGWSGPDRALTMIRPGSPHTKDFVAIDHRRVGTTCRFELFGGGRSWLGPTWTVDTQTASATRARPQSWTSDSSGSLAEWTYRAGDSRITHSVLVLPGRSLALVSAVVEKRSPLSLVPTVRLALPPAVIAEPIEKSRALLLTQTNRPGSAQLIPIGLPSLPYTTDRGAFRSDNDAVALSQTALGRKCWLPLLITWDSKRCRKPLHWRILSVSENSKNVSPDRAFAVRVSWGQGESYLIYRSLAKPAPRAFLGHQTTARLMVGLFNPDGRVEPLMRID